MSRLGDRRAPILHIPPDIHTRRHNKRPLAPELLLLLPFPVLLFLEDLVLLQRWAMGRGEESRVLRIGALFRRKERGLSRCVLASLCVRSSVCPSVCPSVNIKEKPLGRI